MRRTTLLLSILLAAAPAACPGAPREPTQSPTAALCPTAPVLRPGDVTAVQPLWAANALVKSPSYQLAGVIVELEPGSSTRADLEAALRCSTACTTGAPDLLALPGLVAHVDESPDHLATTMTLRSDDPRTAHEVLRRAEALLRR